VLQSNKTDRLTFLTRTAVGVYDTGCRMSVCRLYVMNVPWLSMGIIVKFEVEWRGKKNVRF